MKAVAAALIATGALALGGAGVAGAQGPGQPHHPVATEPSCSLTASVEVDAGEGVAVTTFHYDQAAEPAPPRLVQLYSHNGYGAPGHQHDLEWQQLLEDNTSSEPVELTLGGTYEVHYAGDWYPLGLLVEAHEQCNGQGTTTTTEPETTTTTEPETTTTTEPETTTTTEPETTTTTSTTTTSTTEGTTTTTAPTTSTTAGTTSSTTATTAATSTTGLGTASVGVLDSGVSLASGQRTAMPRTGTPTLELAAIGAGLMAAGSLVLLERRRRMAGSSAG